MNIYINQILISIVITALMLVPCANSEPINRYCLSEIKQKYKSSNLFAKPATQITVPVDNGNTFYITKSHNDYLLVEKRGDKKNFQTVQANQYEYGEINELILSQGGNWLWVNGDETDYVVLIKTYKTSIELETLIPLPKLYSKPCSFIGEWWSNCILAQGHYSYVLDRVFVTGHSPTLFGSSNLSTYEITGKKVKLLKANQPISSVLVNSQQQYPQRLVEISKPSGVIFRDINESDIFYDGENFTPLKKCSRDEI
ncbi:hypothetical protein [Nodularia sphaerocarpa]|uniref:hypothetical protein n=2 Tax=Nodularia sphaerocarpa TaxID=137816 RepID=UPI001EFB4C01|nr:hypothetical protein [Nodularia sphaerocarpa]MDB9376024.1 hypothetical protein [Nodularia sphaerocarpa CS-585]ULP72103.1 hypothetical protein BDGGKGIB_01741 [Nodularia sphaerocarpa UHCC 0038]